ncbi:MAG: DUF4037 domain-containing protein [Emergencia sp.]
MFYLNYFLQQLDRLYEENPRGLEPFLKKGIEDARSLGDNQSVLVLLNELMGYYRVMGSAEGVEKCAAESLELCDLLGLKGTENYATVLLNIATGYRVLGRYDESEAYYKETAQIYEELLPPEDFRIASLHNNLSSLYAETGRPQLAKHELEQAMSLISKLSEADAEIAITHTNLGNVCFQLGENAEGMEHMLKAVEIFESAPGKKDAHYAGALAGLGQAFYIEGKLQEAKEAYEKALAEIEENYGRSEYYNIVSENLALVEDTILRAEAARNMKLFGMEIARLYYETYGRPMLEEKYGEYIDRIAVGLVGEGSECLGFDDETSWDHDFGPGFCMWLTRDDYEEIGPALQADYDALPKELPGIPARKTMETGTGRVGVFCMDDFFRKYVGVPDVPDLNDEDAGDSTWSGFWLKVSREALRTVTNGEIFADPLGEFTARRERFILYPEAVRLQKLALRLGEMAQTGQYNYPRMVKRDDKGAAFMCLAGFVEAAVDAAYLLNDIYPPFYKWKFRGMEEFRCLGTLGVLIEELLETQDHPDEAAALIEKICGGFVQELKQQGLSSSDENFLDAQKAEVMKALYRAEGNTL